MSAPRWLVPVALTAGVVGLALTQRRAPGPGSASGGAHVPGGADTSTGGVTVPTRDELAATHRLLVGRMQQDPGSVAPATLEHLARLLDGAGMARDADNARAWARLRTR